MIKCSHLFTTCVHPSKASSHDARHGLQSSGGDLREQPEQRSTQSFEKGQIKISETPSPQKTHINLQNRDGEKRSCDVDPGYEHEHEVHGPSRKRHNQHRVSELSILLALGSGDLWPKSSQRSAKQRLH